ncbi:MAG: hypothetical protein RLZZ70_22 [Candidatus Parcubacteria bacterium]|jgi:hypothetical protein
MTEIQISKILEQLANHEVRLKQLESGSGLEIFTNVVNYPVTGGKQPTLREIIKGKKLKNGPEKIAVIVGYYEKIIGRLIDKKDIRQNWTEAKIDGAYKTNLLGDAAGAYVRVHTNGECDLTQSGEEFFDNILKNEPTKSTSK